MDGNTNENVDKVLKKPSKSKTASSHMGYRALNNEKRVISTYSKLSQRQLIRRDSKFLSPTWTPSFRYQGSDSEITPFIERENIRQHGIKKANRNKKLKKGTENQDPQATTVSKDSTEATATEINKKKRPLGRPPLKALAPKLKSEIARHAEESPSFSNNDIGNQPFIIRPPGVVAAAARAAAIARSRKLALANMIMKADNINLNAVSESKCRVHWDDDDKNSNAVSSKSPTISDTPAFIEARSDDVFDSYKENNIIPNRKLVWTRQCPIEYQIDMTELDPILDYDDLHTTSDETHECTEATRTKEFDGETDLN